MPRKLVLSGHFLRLSYNASTFASFHPAFAPLNGKMWASHVRNSLPSHYNKVLTLDVRKARYQKEIASI